MKQCLPACALLVCAAAGVLAQPAPNARPFINVLDYGARPDGSGSSTPAFRAAIQACAKAGGGTVFVPAGHYITGAIELVSNLTFYLDSGAVIRFAANRDEYPMVESRFEGTELRAPRPCSAGATWRTSPLADAAHCRRIMPSGARS